MVRKEREPQGAADALEVSEECVSGKNDQLCQMLQTDRNSK